MVTPPAYLEAIALRRDTVAARQAVEPKWRALAAGSSPSWGYVGGALLVLLPPIATGFGLTLEPEVTRTGIFALFTLPTLCPGAVVFVWGATADATKRNYHGALAARPAAKAGEPPGCRSCGAPLAVGPSDLSATCLYCGTDSFLSDLPIDALSTDLGEALTTLEQAARALTLRLRLVRLALLGTAVVVVGLAGALWWAQQQLG